MKSNQLNSFLQKVRVAIKKTLLVLHDISILLMALVYGITLYQMLTSGTLPH